MAMAGEGAEAAAGAVTSTYGGGAGGKFRKRPLHRSQTTPYDRPPTALRNSSWLSKLVVDPASKLISSSAQRFFSSVFRKRLLPPLSPPQEPEEKQETRNSLQETAPNNFAGAQELPCNIGGSSTCNNDTSSISELEQLLKQKTFTQSEINRLTILLHSRAEDLPFKDGGQGIEATPYIRNNLSSPMIESGRHQEFALPFDGEKIERVRGHGALSIPNQNLEDGIASPAELAKAYMGCRPSKVSPSTLRLHSREDAVLLSSSPMTSKSHVSSLALRTRGHLGIFENGFTTPRSSGRSAIYNMARTPYSRGHPTTLQKISGSTNYGFTRPSPFASQSAWNNVGRSASKPTALKRRSSVLDDDSGSVGPIRRIRQKPNLLSLGTPLPSCGMGLGSDTSQLQKLPLVDDTKARISNTPTTSYAHVPPESSEIAARILEHLEKITPKQKSSESKLAAARERSPVKLTKSMLHGQTLKSLEDLDGSELLPNSQNVHTLSNEPIKSFPGSRDSNTQKQDRLEENGPAKFVIPPNKLTPELNTSTTFPMKVSESGSGDGAMPKFVCQTSERTEAFKMSAHEDSLEPDGDVRINEPITKLYDWRGTEKPTTESKSGPGENLDMVKTLFSPEGRTHEAAGSSKTAELALSIAATPVQPHTGFNFSKSETSASSDLTSLTKSALEPNNFATAGNSPSFFSLASTIGKIPSSMESKEESPSSSRDVFTSAADAPLEALETVKSDIKSFKLDSVVNGKVGILPPVASNLTSTTSFISTSVPSCNSGPNIGPLASSATIFPGSFAPASFKLVNPNFTDSSSNMASRASETTISTTANATSTSAASSSGFFVSNEAPSTSLAPVFKFKSSEDPSISMLAASTIANTMTTDVKVQGKENIFANISNSCFGTTSLEAASNGSGIFSLASSPAANTLLMVSVAASGSVVSTEPSPAGSGIAIVSQSLPVQFGSSSSPMASCSSATSFFSSSSSFGSSAPAVKLSFADATTRSSPASTSVTNVVNGVTPSTFKFGGSSASSESNAVSTSGAAPPGAFTLGVSSAASAISSSSVTPGFFSIGAGSSATSSSSTTPGVFSFGASSSVSSSPAVAFTSGISTAAGTFSFGAKTPVSSSEANLVASGGANSGTFGSNWQASKSPIFGQKFNSASPLTGFSFGASASSFGAANSAPLVFGSTTGASSSPNFSFSAVTATTSSLPSSSTQSVFGNNTSPFAASPGNNDQMNMEDSMAEDPAQSSSPTAPAFGQALVSPSPPGFMFESTTAAPFQFGNQQNQAAPQNPQFQVSGSVEFNAGGGFSLGSSGPDISGRKIIKVNRNRNRKR